MKSKILMAFDDNRPTAEWDRIELRGGMLIVGCKCVRNDGMQHECRRAKCMGQPQCLVSPAPTCQPSQLCPPSPQPRRSHTKETSSALMTSGSNGLAAIAVGTLKHKVCRTDVATNRRLRDQAINQYDTRPAHRKLFEPCQIHARRVHRKSTKVSPRPPPPKDPTKLPGRACDEYNVAQH